jgi:hypothetical protein
MNKKHSKTDSFIIEDSDCVKTKNWFRKLRLLCIGYHGKTNHMLKTSNFMKTKRVSTQSGFVLTSVFTPPRLSLKIKADRRITWNPSPHTSSAKPTRK